MISDNLFGIIKGMQSSGVFEIMPYTISIKEAIDSLKNSDDIKLLIPHIKCYIDNLTKYLSNNVKIGSTLYDFYDKFHYEIFNLYCSNYDKQEGLYYKKTRVGKKRTKYKTTEEFIEIGLKSVYNAKFTLEERKVLKLINHYYINLKNDAMFNGNYFYIPYNVLKLFFSNGKNHFEIKKTIVDTCNSINDKSVYWNLNNTFYSKNEAIEQGKLCFNNSSIVDITVLYRPWNKKDNVSIVGIICKVSKFMKLRYILHQINSLYFPTKVLSANYLDFCITDYVIYRMIQSQNRKKGRVSIYIDDVLNNIFQYSYGFNDIERKEYLMENYDYYDDLKKIVYYKTNHVKKMHIYFKFNDNLYDLLKWCVIKETFFLTYTKELCKEKSMIYNFNDYHLTEKNINQCIIEDCHKPRELLKLLGAIIKLAENLTSLENVSDCYLDIEKIKIPLTTVNRVGRNSRELYHELLCLFSGNYNDVKSIESTYDELIKLPIITKSSLVKILEKNNISNIDYLINMYDETLFNSKKLQQIELLKNTLIKDIIPSRKKDLSRELILKRITKLVIIYN